MRCQIRFQHIWHLERETTTQMFAIQTDINVKYCLVYRSCKRYSMKRGPANRCCRRRLQTMNLCSPMGDVRRTHNVHVRALGNENLISGKASDVSEWQEREKEHIELHYSNAMKSIAECRFEHVCRTRSVWTVNTFSTFEYLFHCRLLSLLLLMLTTCCISF